MQAASYIPRYNHCRINSKQVASFERAHSHHKHGVIQIRQTHFANRD